MAGKSDVPRYGKMYLKRQHAHLFTSTIPFLSAVKARAVRVRTFLRWIQARLVCMATELDRDGVVNSKRRRSG